MKTNIACLFVTAGAAAALLSIPTIASADLNPVSQLAVIYGKTDSAADRKDIDGCLAFHSANFMQLDPDGQIVTTDQERTRLGQLFDSIGPMDVTTHIDKCDYAEKTATVIITQHIKTTVTSPDTGKQISVSGDVQARELWTKDTDGWKIDVAQTLTTGQLTPDQ